MTSTNNLNASLRLFNPGTTQGLASDSRSVDALRSTAARDPKAAVKDAAKQFEALFMQELMKSMRQASLSSGMLDNAGSQMGTEMLDTQYASMMTGMPRGLSEAIARQLERQMGGAEGSDTAQSSDETAPEFGEISARLQGLNNTLVTPNALASRMAPHASGVQPEPLTTTGNKLSPSQIKQVDFVKRHTQAANEASAVTGIPASFMVAQAAHESGWGRREIKLPDGSNSFNVFGIKATPGWTGPVAEVTTTEYQNGRAHTVKAKFRAYDSYESAFKDYAQMLKNSPRYGQVVASANTAQGFAQGLQRAGYATDPAYADKLTRVINTTMRLQRMMT